MSFKVTKATRQKIWMKLGLAAPSGFGKTYSALLLAHGLTDDWAKICVIDTENNSAKLYSHLGQFNHIDFQPPYTPERYVEAIASVPEETEVVIIDSFSHLWSGTGGSLDLQAKLGGKFQDWAQITPRHRRAIDAVLQTPRHFIINHRTKTDWDVSKDDRGKAKVEKVGTKLEQREGFEYELTINWRLNQNYLATPDKDRTGIFLTPSGAVPEVITEATGKKILDWLKGGIEAPKAPEVIFDQKNKKHLDGLQKKLELRHVPPTMWDDIAVKLNGRPTTDTDKLIAEAGL